MKSLPYLITGSTGFLGRHLIEYLQAQTPETPLIPLVRNAEDWEKRSWGKDLPPYTPACTSVHEILKAENQLPKTLGGIFHLAALVKHSRIKSEEVYHTNIEGTLNMVRLAAQKKCRLVFISTSGTVGVFNTRREWADEHAPYRVDKVSQWPYYHSKIIAEREARKLAQELGVEMVIIRPPVLLGPGDHRYRSTSHIIRYLRKKLPFLIRGGMHFIDIRDAAAAISSAMNHPEPQPIYHLSGVACSIDSFFRMVEDASGVTPPPFHLPYSLALGIANSASMLSRIVPGMHESPLPDPVVIEMANKYWDVRSRYAARDLGFVNRHGQDTIQDTVAWLIDNHPKLSHLQGKTALPLRFNPEQAQVSV